MKNFILLLLLILSFNVKSQMNITADINWGCWAGENLFYVYSPSGVYLGGACWPSGCYNGASGSYSSNGIVITNSTPNACGNYFIDMYDSWGDGWNCGGSVTLRADGRIIGTYNLGSGSYQRVFFTIPLGYEIAAEGAAINSSASACNNSTTSLGGGSWRDINISQNTWYNFTWALSPNSNAGRIRPLNGNSTTVTGNQTAWFSGTTTQIRVSTNRSTCTWNATSAVLTYRHTQPNAVSVSGGGTQCGSSRTLNASGGGNGVIYWQNTTSGGVSITTQNTSQSVSSSGTYYFRAVNGGCWGDQGSAGVTINEVPNPPTAVAGSRCGTGAVTLSVNDVTGVTVDWFSGSTGGTPLANSTTSFTTPSISTTTNYYAESRNLTTGCISNQRTAVTATINSLPSQPDDITGAITTCEGNVENYSINSVNGAVSYQWGVNLSGTWVNLVTTTTQTNWDITWSDSYNNGAVRVRSRDANGCLSSYRNLSGINILEAPTSPTGIDFDFDNNTLTAIGGTNGSGSEFQWGTDLVGTNILPYTTATINPDMADEQYWVRRVGITACNNQTEAVVFTTPKSLLPIEMGDVFFKCGILKWQTLSEKNSSHFHIFGSDDGINWELVKEILSKSENGFSNNEIFYSVFLNYKYAKLIQYDFDNQFQIFGPVYSNCIEPSNKLETEVFPNPTYGETFIGIRNNQREDAQLIVSDISGRVIFQEDINLIDGYTLKTLEMKNYQSGVYQFILITSNYKYIHRVIKK